MKNPSYAHGRVAKEGRNSLETKNEQKIKCRRRQGQAPAFAPIPSGLGPPGGQRSDHRIPFLRPSKRRPQQVTEKSPHTTAGTAGAGDAPRPLLWERNPQLETCSGAGGAPGAPRDQWASSIPPDNGPGEASDLKAAGARRRPAPRGLGGWGHRAVTLPTALCSELWAEEGREVWAGLGSSAVGTQTRASEI